MEIKFPKERQNVTISVTNPPIIASENQQGITLIEYCRVFNIPIVHIANEGKRCWAFDEKKAIRKGFPDYFIPMVKMPYGGLFIELKKDKSSRVSIEQWEWIAHLNKLSYIATIAYGLDQAINFIDKYREIPTNTWKWEKFLNMLNRISN